jgi:hypothetical protein
MIHCGNCNSEVAQNYCAYCGHPARLKRIDRQYIQHEIIHVLHFEKGIFYTVRELLIRPGENVRTFIGANRNRLVKPILFIIVSSLIYTIISHLVHTNDAFIPTGHTRGTATHAINKWIESHYGYSNILMGIFIACWLRIFFSKSAYNFFEILILLCFVMGAGMLIYSLSTLVEGITSWRLLPITSIVCFVYLSWAIGQFFDGTGISGYLKAAAAYVLGMMSFSLIAFASGWTIDLLIPH